MTVVGIIVPTSVTGLLYALPSIEIMRVYDYWLCVYKYKFSKCLVIAVYYLDDAATGIA